MSAGPCLYGWRRGPASESAAESLIRASLDDEEQRTMLISVMPALARELVDVIGLLPTIELLRKFGGKRLGVPLKLNESSKLVAAVGQDIAAKLIDAMPGARLEPPMLASVERLLRDNAIRSDFDRMCREGPADIHALVDRYRVTQRHIRKVLKASSTVAPAAHRESRQYARVGRLLDAAASALSDRPGEQLEQPEQPRL